MSGFCKVIMIGRVGRDPEMRHMNSGKAVTNFSVAVSIKRRGETGPTEDTTWHRVTMYERLAEVASQYVRKGSLVYIEGNLRYGKYTDKNGVEKDTTEIIGNVMQMLGGKSDGDNQRQDVRREAPAQRSIEEDDTDIPF